MQDQKPPSKGFCFSCGKVVDTVTILAKGDERTSCSICGSPVEEVKEEAEIKKELPPPPKKLERVIAAEDSQLLREMMGDILKSKGMVDQYVSCGDGEEAIALFTRAVTRQKKVDLVILDITMPKINGIVTGMAIRAIEKGAGLERPTPLLFFSIKQADEQMRSAFNYLKPSSYVNKGASTNPNELAERFYMVLHKLLSS